MAKDVTEQQNVVFHLTCIISDDIGAVLLAYHATALHISQAREYLRNPGTLFFNIYPEPNGLDREPILLAKPGSTVFEQISDVHHINPARTIMIGDSAAIDIMFGKKNGVRTLLAETVKNNLEDVENWLNSGDYNKVPH